MEFNIDFGSIHQATQAAVPANAPLYASIDGRVAHLGGDEIVFFDPRAGQSHVMTMQVLEAMDLCREFQPLELHAQRVATQVNGMQGQAQAVKRVLESLAGRGLMQSDDAFLQTFERVPARHQTELSGIYIRACNRPAQLKRLLQSLADHHKQFPLLATVVIVDDSTDAEAATQHRRLAQEFAQQHAPARYIGHQEWQQMADLLCTKVDQPDALRALLSRPQQHWGRRGGGVGKNLISLLSAGRRYLLLDDDFVLPMARHPEFKAGLQLSGSAWAVRTYAEVEQAIGAGAELDFDPLARHLDFCGQALGPLLSHDQELALNRNALRGMAPSRLAELNPDSRILATINGHRGSSGASGLAWMFLLDPEARRGWLSDASKYGERRSDPAVFWACNRFQTTPVGTFTPFAVDGSEILPPTSAYGRGEDALFSALCRLTHQDSVQLDVPFAVGHLQEQGRDRSELLDQAETPDVNHYLAELARDHASALVGATAARRMGGFSALLRDMTDASNQALSRQLNEFLIERRSLLLQQLHTVAQSTDGLPEAWKADLIKLIEANGNAVIDRGAPRFSGWKQGIGKDECCEAFREEATALADGLAVWPQAWEYAQQSPL